MASLQHDSSPISFLKAAVAGTTLFIAGGMATTSSQTLPSLIATASTFTYRSNPRAMDSGRLTPQPSTENKTINLTVPGSQPVSSPNGQEDSTAGYKIAAKQFVGMSRTAFAMQVPPELLTILASGYLAWHSYRHRLSTPSSLPNLPASSILTAWQKWTAVAVLVASVFPLTGALMVPLYHKIARLADEEDGVEPYEDAPPDRGAERSNAVEFLGKWNGLNVVRSAVMLVAGCTGLWALRD